MAELTAQTTFTILEPLEVFEETADLVLLPENTGTDALRELRYPGDMLPPLIYGDNPDKTENFDTGPLTARPLVKSEMTLEGALLAQWPGYLPDRPVKETWQGDSKRSRMTAYFLRRLWEYFANPPASGYLTWTPKDRLDQAYHVVFENLAVGGQDTISLEHLPLRAGFVMGEVILTLRIVGEAS